MRALGSMGTAVTATCLCEKEKLDPSDMGKRLGGMPMHPAASWSHEMMKVERQRLTGEDAAAGSGADGEKAARADEAGCQWEREPRSGIAGTIDIRRGLDPVGPVPDKLSEPTNDPTRGWGIRASPE
jgi:hypothetical protein